MKIFIPENVKLGTTHYLVGKRFITIKCGSCNKILIKILKQSSTEYYYEPIMCCKKLRAF